MRLCAACRPQSRAIATLCHTCTPIGRAESRKSRQSAGESGRRRPSNVRRKQRLPATTERPPARSPTRRVFPSRQPRGRPQYRSGERARGRGRRRQRRSPNRKRRAKQSPKAGMRKGARWGSPLERGGGALPARRPAPAGRRRSSSLWSRRAGARCSRSTLPLTHRSVQAQYCGHGGVWRGCRAACAGPHPASPHLRSRAPGRAAGPRAVHPRGEGHQVARRQALERAPPPPSPHGDCPPRSLPPCCARAR